MTVDHARILYFPMPTGVGFCMGMNLKAIQEVGLLDEENFGKGYGEENDWCQRAIAAGYENVHVDNLFVYHKHGGSFPSEEKQRLLKEHSEALLRKLFIISYIFYFASFSSIRCSSGK